MTYAVKEIFLTLQGEGTHTGRAAVFLRFAGCNLWSGREQDRAAAQCRFCDTDFVGGTKYPDAGTLADAVAAAWTGGTNGRYVVITGGEPGLQLDEALIEALHERGFEVGVETNGTVDLPMGVDWVCVSPKAGTELKITTANELKLIFPQPGAEPERYEHLNVRHWYLQPMDGPDRDANTQACVRYCLTHPRWRISLQTHKLIGIP